MYIFLLTCLLFFSFIFIRQNIINSKERKIYPREPEYFQQFIQYVKIDLEIIESMSKEFSFTWKLKDQVLEITDQSQKSKLGQWFLKISIQNNHIQTVKKFFKTSIGQKKLFTQTGDFDI